MSEEDTLFEFPCQFPIKAMGKNSPEFDSIVVGIVRQHVDDLKRLLKEHNIVKTPVYLQPISQKTRATELAIVTCIANNWRLSVQVHKYLGIE